MISERLLASEFHGFWSDLLPLLTPAYVRVFNEAYALRITDESDDELTPIPMRSSVRHHDVVAEIAFNVARLAFELGLSSAAVAEDEEARASALRGALRALKQFDRSQAQGFDVSDAEWDEALRLASVYPHFLRPFSGRAAVEFAPLVPGSGFLPSCAADLAVGQTLIEVKTVNRSISGKDIRQLITYLALDFASGARRWTDGGFFNPRRAMRYEFSMDHLVYRASGGRATTDVYAEIIDFLTSREVDLGIAF